MSERRVTRAELVKALASIGVHARSGNGYAGMHRADSAAIVAVDMWGAHVALNGERDASNVSLIVQVDELEPPK